MANITVYGAPWCPDCRRSKQFLGEQRVPYRWIDVDKDSDGREHIWELQNGGQSIPTIVFDDGSFLVEPSNAELADKLGIRPRAERQYYELVVVGSGPAGLTAAIYAAREGLDTLVIERSGLGGQTGATERIENYPGFTEGIGGTEMADQLRIHAERFGVEILPAQAVSSIMADGDYRLTRTETGDEYCSRAVLLAPGSRYRRLNVPGEEDFIGAGIHFCATCDGPFYKGQEIVVVGGGNSGIEESLFLTKFATRITVLEYADRLMASRILQDKVARLPQIEVRLRHTVEECRGNGQLKSVVVKDLETGVVEEMTPGAVFIFIGLDPNTDFLKGVVDLDPRGFIETGAPLETNIPGVFAAGDARAGSTKQVASAVGEGATAALMIRQFLEATEGSRGYSRE